MLTIEVYSSRSLIIGDQATLSKINQEFSFKNKRVQSSIFRFQKGFKWKEKRLMETLGELPKEYLDHKEATLAPLRAKLNVFLCDLNQGSMIAPTGLVPRIQAYLKDIGVQFTTFDIRDFGSLSKKYLSGAKLNYLRTPQREGLLALNASRPMYGVGMYRIATGCGKTGLAQEIIRELGHKSIFLVPSQPILKQTVKRFERAFGKKYVGTYGGGVKDIRYVTVATYQSVYKGDPEDFQDFDVAIFDEVHHVGADTFFDVAVNRLKHTTHRYGLTAFEERADGGTMLVEAACGPVIYSYDVEQGIKEGYLAKPMFMFYDITKTSGTWVRKNLTDPKKNKTIESIEYDGDDNLLSYRHWILGNDLLNNAVAQITEAFVEDGLSVLILVDEKEHGERLLKLMPNAGFAVGGGKDNERLMKEFNERKLKRLIGTSTLGEGADTIPVDVLINLQGGASVSAVKQAYGRALRNEEDENGVPQKPTTLIVDFNFPKSRMFSRHFGIRKGVALGMAETVSQGTLV